MNACGQFHGKKDSNFDEIENDNYHYNYNNDNDNNNMSSFYNQNQMNESELELMRIREKQLKRQQQIDKYKLQRARDEALIASEIDVSSTSEERHFDDFGEALWMSKTRDLLSLERQLLKRGRELNNAKNEQFLLQTKFQKQLKMNPETMF